MRKTYASTLINNNVPIPVVQKRLGHSEPGTTMRYYVFDNTDKSKEDEIVRNALNKRFED
jgi:integrase